MDAFAALIVCATVGAVAALIAWMINKVDQDRTKEWLEKREIVNENKGCCGGRCKKSVILAKPAAAPIDGPISAELALVGDEDNLYTTEQAADLAGVSMTTIRVAVKHNELINFGKKNAILVNHLDLMEWIKNYSAR